VPRCKCLLVVTSLQFDSAFSSLAPFVNLCARAHLVYSVTFCIHFRAVKCAYEIRNRLLRFRRRAVAAVAGVAVVVVGMAVVGVVGSLRIKKAGCRTGA
jgi:hypothetical protein